MSGLRDIQKLKYWLENCNNKDLRLGWYSSKQREYLWEKHNFIHRCDGIHIPCAHIWCTPDGKEVTVTNVSLGYDSGCVWDDMKLIGPIIQYVKPVYNVCKKF